MISQRFEALDPIRKSVRLGVECHACVIVVPAAENDIQDAVMSHRQKLALANCVPRQPPERPRLGETERAIFRHAKTFEHLPTVGRDELIDGLHRGLVRNSWRRHLVPPDSERWMNNNIANDRDVRELQEVRNAPLYPQAFFDSPPLLFL